ncbi:kelch-like protein 8 isoform X2 [Mizuhopecten yessoensis]|uniref:kelch-like protein 8 isoform X2 n=1 Tax=Mizuhopecten yessoensis TaxID=6573 RepID=UPI000B45B950|nr:kelch-like protein 8 isoform X2 [Mizuhopecten yessoensis]
MPGAPPLPQRSDSLPSSITPPVPPKPATHQLPSFRPVSVSKEESHAKPKVLKSKSYGNLKKMATLEHLNIESSIVQDFEYKSHYKHSFKTFLEFYEKDQLCDVEIKVGEKSFRCHRMVLACVSQYFRIMFMSEMSESRQETITIHDIDESAMEKLIKFAYTSKIHLSVDTVQPILYAASILQIETVAKACCEFMKKHLHPTNCIGVHNFAEQHNRTELMKMADDYILENFLEVVETEEFKNVSVKLMCTIMASSDLNVSNEIEAYESVIKWVKSNPENRKKNLAELLSHLKLPLLSVQYLQKHVATEELIKHDLACRDLLDEAKYYKMSVANLLTDISISERTRPRKSYAGVLFCVGGRGASGDPFKSIECYDYRKNRWFQVSEMNTRRRHVGVCCASDLLYAVGGHDGTKHLNSGEVFDPKSNTWTSISPMSTPRRGIALACLGGPIYAVGGLDDSTCFNTVERFDQSSDSWTFVASMNTPRGGVGVATLNGCLYAVGGNDGVSSLDKCEMYNPFNNKWSFIASMNRHRAGAGVAVQDGYIYVVGGFDDNAPLDSCEQYDPRTDKWTTVASMSCCRGGVGVGTMGGRLYAVGGHDGTNYLSSVEAYDPLIDRWDAVSSIAVRQAGGGVTHLSCSADILLEVCHNTRSLNDGAAGKL